MSDPALTMPDRRLIVPELRATGPRGYTVDGRPLVAVTDVIHTVLRAPQLEEWFKRVGPRADQIRDDAAAFGKSIHAGLSAYARGQALVPLAMGEGWHRTIEAGVQWLDRALEEIMAVEQPIASLKYGYAGTPDLYGRRRHVPYPCIIDYKATGDLYWDHRFQTAAYRQAAVETYQDPAAERIVIIFSKEYPGRIYPFLLKHHERDLKGWKSLLVTYEIMKTGVKE